MSQPRITAARLVNDLKGRLKLSWLVEAGAADRSLERPPGDLGSDDDSQGAANNTADPLPLVGYLNLIHPNQIQIAGQAELDWLRKANRVRLPELLEQIFPHNAGMLLVANNRELPDWLQAEFQEAGIPVASSPQPGHELTNRIESYLATQLGQRETLHGVFMEVLGVGVLITGPSGIGKSELALELITRGHRFIADDCPEFLRVGPDTIDGACPLAVQDFLEVRGLGIINVRAMFGSSAIKRNKYLRLIMNLTPLDGIDPAALDRLRGSRKTADLLGVAIPEITLPVTAGRNLAVLVEAAVREHLLRLHGYEAADDFTEQQRGHIERGDDLPALARPH